jgi:membrane associated rhomboid family serine protease
MNLFQRKTSGSVVCPSCGSLVGVNDTQCYMCGRRNPSLWGFSPLVNRLGADLGFVPLVAGASIVVYVLTLVASGGNVAGGGGLSILAPDSTVLVRFGASGAIPVFVLGNWWSVLSATWLHGGLLHILFNMMSLRVIGPLTADVLGPGRTMITYVVAGACGFLLSSFAAEFLPPLPLVTGAGVTVGASASVCGLIGVLLYYGRSGGSSMIRAQATQWAIMIAIYGLVMRGIDNLAHLGGFLGGYGMAAIFNPMTRERGDHILIGIASLILSFAAIAASLLKPLPF